MSLLRNHIYRIARRSRTYYVRACDCAAVDLLATQYGFPVKAIERAHEMSKKAISMSEYAAKERARQRLERES